MRFSLDTYTIIILDVINNMEICSFVVLTTHQRPFATDICSTTLNVTPNMLKRNNAQERKILLNNVKELSSTLFTEEALRYNGAI